MKKSHLAGVSFGALALATGAQAADPARPVVMPTWSWTGFYVGANVGAAGARTNISNPSNNFFFSTGANFDSTQVGIIGGLEAGYNFQFNSLVLGIEGDISAASVNRTTLPAGIAGAGDTFYGDLSALGTVRGRVGLAFDRLMVYGTGGVAFANFKDQYVTPTFGGFVADPGSSVTGWTAGGGIELVLLGNWTTKVEYLHVAFPTRSATVSPFGAPYTFAFKDSLDIGRVGINYKF